MGNKENLNAVDIDYSDYHDNCHDNEENLSPFLQLLSKNDGVQALLLETGGIILVMMVVMMF